MNKMLFLALSIPFILLVSISFSNGQAACSVNDVSACGERITTFGHGAVELCSNCFVCGVEDGVCPAWYSIGENSSSDFYVLLRKGTNDKIGVPSDYSIVYNTGNEACSGFGGVFKNAQSKSNFADSWSNTVSISSSTPMTSRNDYVRAVCSDVSMRPSCDTCVDPDCLTILKGTVYAPRTAEYDPFAISGASITILPRMDKNTIILNRSAVSGVDGTYNVVGAYSGNVTIYCAADGYEYIERNVTLLPGINIIDCPLDHGTCDSDCTIPSGQIGVRVCSPACQGINGCDYTTLATPEITADLMMNVCDGRPLGYSEEINVSIGESTVTTTSINCCNTPTTQTRNLINLDNSGGDISSLLTRKFNKILSDGSPVFLHIIVYNK